MRLSDLMAGLPEGRLEGDASTTISGLNYDSREIQPGDLFVCLKGCVQDGHNFAAPAVRKGAVALMAERRLDGLNVPQIVVSDSRLGLAATADRFYGQPSKDITLIGVTGTNGKTTTTYLVESILRAAGLNTGMLGTVENKIAKRSCPVKLTTPESADLQKLLKEMVDAGVEAAVMEVSSHALHQRRVANCRFDVGVFTNLSHDHLDYHPTIEDYFQAKLLLFHGYRGRKPTTILNADDQFGRRIEKELDLAAISYSTKAKVDIYASRIHLTPTGSRASIVTPKGEFDVQLNLPGSFNVYNALAATGVGLALDLTVQQIKSGLEALVSVPGRFERVDRGQDFTVIIDYAHTPDSLEKVLRAARELTTGRVIAVFGCGGDRDKEKRPVMGRIAGEIGDYVFLTSDNPRSEDPEIIIRQIEQGLKRATSDYVVEVDRKSAIRSAVAEAREGDFVVIAGKGHETGQKFADKTVPFDDKNVAIEALEERAACCR